MKTKIILFSLLIFISFQNLNAQAPNWLWAKSAGGIGGTLDEATSVSTDALGNSYVTGYFYNRTITFGSISIPNTDTTGITQDMFIAKYDANGNVLWAKSARGSQADWANSVTADAFGNIYVAGNFGSSSITFDSYTLINANAPYRDIFIVKYDTNGNVLWAESAGGANSEIALSIITDVSNNIYVAGNFTSSYITFGSYTLSNSGSSDIFIVKYDTIGNVLWAKSAGGIYADGARSVSTDASGNIYVAGFFDSPSITFDSYTLTNDTSNNTPDIFLAKYDSNGNVLWAKSAGGSHEDFANSIKVDASGNVLVGGSFASPSITFGSTVLSNASWGTGDANMFLTKYDSNGNILWAKCATGYGGKEVKSISTDALSNILISGDFDGILAIGSDTINNVAGNPNMFIVKFNSNGNAIWIKSIEGHNFSKGNSITSSNLGNIKVAGYISTFSLPIIFGPDTLTSIGYDMFIANLSGVVGINEVSSNTNSLIIYPNPLISSSILQLNTQLKDVQVIIYDMLGKEMLRRKMTGNKIVIERGGFENGVYFVRIIGDEKQLVGKMVVE